jgi:hypothetical protein
MKKRKILEIDDDGYKITEKKDNVEKQDISFFERKKIISKHTDFEMIRIEKMKLLLQKKKKVEELEKEIDYLNNLKLNEKKKNVEDEKIEKNEKIEKIEKIENIEFETRMKELKEEEEKEIKKLDEIKKKELQKYKNIIIRTSYIILKVYRLNNNKFNEESKDYDVKQIGIELKRIINNIESDFYPNAEIFIGEIRIILEKIKNYYAFFKNPEKEEPYKNFAFQNFKNEKNKFLKRVRKFEKFINCYSKYYSNEKILNIFNVLFFF